MNRQTLFSIKGPAIIAGLHLPPSPASNQTTSVPMDKIIEFALKNTEKAVRAGVPALYIQDLADLPVAPAVQPHTVAFLSVVGAAIRKEFPQLILGVCMMSHGGREPLAVAQAIGAQFVRIKVYTGAMEKRKVFYRAAPMKHSPIVNKLTLKISPFWQMYTIAPVCHWEKCHWWRRLVLRAYIAKPMAWL